MMNHRSIIQRITLSSSYHTRSLIYAPLPCILAGWKRMCLLVLYFNPFDLLTPDASFDAISKRLIVGPVVETLVYNKTPKAVRDMCKYPKYISRSLSHLVDTITVLVSLCGAGA